MKKNGAWAGALLLIAGGATAAGAVGRYDVFELTLTYRTAGLADPYNEAVAVATFTAPSGRTLAVPGFYYDVNTYKVRFAPAELGNYTYTAFIAGPSAFQPLSGFFTSTASSNHGFVRKWPGAPYKLMFDDGSLFYGMGINDCTDANDPTYGVIGDPAVEPAGEAGKVSWDAYFQKYGQDGGFNLFRWNCVELDSLADKVTADKAKDAVFQAAKAHGFHVLTVIFPGNGTFFPDPAQHPNDDALFKNLVRYRVARFGAYTDMWEWTNETQSDMDAFLAYARNYLYTLDPYRRLITNSNPTSRPPLVDFESPHKYSNNLDFFSLTNKTAGPPVVPGEVGRCAGCGTAAYTPQTVARMRIADWTGFFGGAGVIYWNTSFKTTCCNQYIGSKERAQNLVLKNFATGSDIDVDAQAAVAATGPNRVGYTLTSHNSLVAYVYDSGFSASPVSTPLTVALPFNGTAAWVDPKTGHVVSTAAVTAGNKTLTTPPFIDDIALRVTPAVAGDTTPPVLSSIASSGVGTSAAAVSWLTNEPADGQVFYGLTATYGSGTAVAAALATTHSFILSGLAPGTAYHFQVRSKDAAGNARSSADFGFTTLPSSSTRIMPFGDSITYGVGDPASNSYRKDLHAALWSSGLPVDFVGALQGGDFADTNHQGTGGITIQGLDAQVAGGLLQQYFPDVILLLIGTNNVQTATSDVPGAVAALNQLIDHIFQASPTVSLVVGAIPYRRAAGGVFALQPQIDQYNAGAQAAVAARQPQGKKIFFANIGGALTDPNADYADSLHPNVTGYSKMAVAWAQALGPALAPPAANPVPAAPRNLRRR